MVTWDSSSPLGFAQPLINSWITTITKEEQWKKHNPVLIARGAAID